MRYAEPHVTWTLIGCTCQVILKEREERKRLRLLDDTQDPAPLSPPTAAADDDGDDDDDDDDCEEEEDDNNDEEEEEEDGTNAGGVAEFVESSQEGNYRLLT